MRSKIFLFLSCLILLPVSLFAQRLQVGATPIGRGEIKIGEPLVTRDGVKLNPGLYRISIALSSRGEGQFVLSTYKNSEEPSQEPLNKNAMNTRKEFPPEQTIIPAAVIKNVLVRGIASNIEGTFVLENISPTEVLLTFNSKQFGANAMLGRSLESKLIDLLPTFLTFEQVTECGDNCIEGYVKVTVRNDGNAEAKGKWNVVVTDPHFYVGTVSDEPAFGEQVVTSPAKLKLPCCAPATLEVEVHADFYNQDGVDSNDSNNSRRFTVKLKE